MATASISTGARTIRRSSGFWGSTRPRFAGWSTIFLTTRHSAPRRGRSLRVRSRRRPKSNSCVRSTLDPFGRTLAYLFINGRNYSVMVIKARYSGETVSHYGDNGLPKEAAEVMAAAKEAGASRLPFEPPHLYRARMRR